MTQFDQPVERRGTSSIKWDRCAGKFGTDRELIPLWIADTDFRAPGEVLEAMHRRVDHGVFGYSFAGEDYTAATCDWMRRRHAQAVEPDWVCATTSVVSALFFSILALTEPGDDVLVFTPIYDPFFNVIRTAGRRAVHCALRRVDGRYEMDLDALEQALRGGVKLVLFCNPHNPTGRVWTPEELAALAALCARHGAWLVSDEIHCDFALFGHRYTSMLACESIRDRLVVCSAAAKTFNLAGMHASHLFIPDPEVRAAVCGALRGAGIMGPNLLGAAATVAAYRYGENWLDEQLRYLEDNSELVRNTLRERMPRIQAATHEGTFLMWLDFAAFGLGPDELCATLAGRCGVGLGPGAVYGGDGDRHMRLNIGCRRALLADALAAMAAVFGG